MCDSRNTRMLHNGKAMSRQRGVVIPIVVIGLLAMLAVAGMALDGSHALANKTRMQNTVDAAALAAAKVLTDTDGDTGLATAAADSLFSINAGGVGNHELNDAYAAGDITVTVQYSTLVNPFTPGSSNGPFVRVIATGFDTETTLSRVLGINEIPTPATAVAGPSGPLGSGDGAQLCDVAPIAVCTYDQPETGSEDVLRVLKPDPGVHGDIGPGNYKMLRIGCSGGDCLRENMAGSYDECLTVSDDPEDTVDTEPGVSSGPVSQGFNTRFDELQAGLTAPPYFPDEDITEQGGYELKSCAPTNDPLTDYIFLTDGPGNNYCKDFPDDYDPDDPENDTLPEPYASELVTYSEDINYNYCNYSNGDATCNSNAPEPATFIGPLNNYGQAYRRLLNFPLINCDGLSNGQTDGIAVEGFACFFMLQSLEGGQADGAGQIFGQFIESCPANGTGGTDPGGGPADPLLYKIQLYKDPDSGDS